MGPDDEEDEGEDDPVDVRVNGDPDSLNGEEDESGFDDMPIEWWPDEDEEDDVDDDEGSEEESYDEDEDEDDE